MVSCPQYVRRGQSPTKLTTLLPHPLKFEGPDTPGTPHPPRSSEAAPGDAERSALKRLVKDAVAEALVEQRGYLQSLISETLEELALAEAMREVEAVQHARPHQSFRQVEGKA